MRSNQGRSEKAKHAADKRRQQEALKSMSKIEKLLKICTGIVTDSNAEDRRRVDTISK